MLLSFQDKCTMYIHVAGSIGLVEAATINISTKPTIHDKCCLASEQVPGWCPLDLGLVMKDEPSELSCTCTCTLQLHVHVLRWFPLVLKARHLSGSAFCMSI